MDKKKIPLNAYLIFACILLVILYSFSVFKKPEAEQRKALSTALVNPKYRDDISRISIFNGGKSLTLDKSLGYWQLLDDENEYIKLAADSSLVNKMLEELTSVIDVYKVSDKGGKVLKDFGLESAGQEAFIFDFYCAEEKAGEILFGKNDFSQTNRYVKSASSSTVYETKDFIQNYLSTSIQFWSEPFIISQNVCGAIKASDIQRVIINNKVYTPSSKDFSSYTSKLLELRHGGFYQTAAGSSAAGQLADGPSAAGQFADGQSSSSQLADGDVVEKIQLELGNKNQIDLYVYKTEVESEYFCKIIYNRKDFFYFNISAWTLGKLKYE